MQMSIGLDRLKRFVCLLLIFVLLFCFFMCPRASAVALEATTIAYGGLLVGTILVGAGVVFSSHGDMVKVGNAMYKTLVNGSSAIGKTISSISAWAVEHGTSLAKGALRVGKDLYQTIVDAFNASYSNGFFSDGAHVSFAVDASADDCKSFASVLLGWVKEGRSFTVYTTGRYSDEIIRQDFTPSFDSDGTFHLEIVDDGDVKRYGGYVPARWSYDGLYSSYYNYMMASFSVYNSSGGGQGFDFCRQAVAAVGNLVPAPADDLAYPSDDYLVKMPDIPSVDTATGEVTYPDSIAYTKDAVAAPYPIGDDGVKVPDIPFDIPVDQTSGKPMEDTGTDTDTPSKPGEGTDTDKPSDSVNWPSAGDISLPKLIISKFPFCIPFDVARLIGLLEADPKTPVFHVPLKVGTILDEEIVLDLSQWDNAVRIIRWGELIVFVAGLVLVTRNYIKW